MKKIVFYSWQSDLPNPTNRGFIQSVLENAVTTIANDNTVEVEPVVDRDTQGVAGAPDIASTIFAKITASDVFIADVSIIAHPKNGRPVPNPNVLIELGYALRGLGHERIVLIFNRSYGKIEELPFDLKMRRLVTYEMPLKEENRAPERLKLEKQLETAIRSALDYVPKHEENIDVIPAIAAIENNQPNKIIILRRNLTSLLKKVLEKQPKKHSSGGTVDELAASIDSTQELVAEFSKIVEVVSIIKDPDSAIEIYKWFGSIFEQYNPQAKDGRTSNADGDYFKFIGHEMFVTMISFYIREQAWDILKKILSEPVIVENIKYANGPSNVEWHYASEHLPLFLDESKNKKRLSLHADILNTRHTTGGLSSIIPMGEFCSTDFFLFLLGELPSAEYGDGFFDWRPWSVLYLKNVPKFIINAERKQYASQLASTLGVAEMNEFKKRLKKRYPVVHKLFSGGFWHLPTLDADIDKIATR